VVVVVGRGTVTQTHIPKTLIQGLLHTTLLPFCWAILQICSSRQFPKLILGLDSKFSRDSALEENWCMIQKKKKKKTKTKQQQQQQQQTKRRNA
jgi:ERCC4-type nuclease